MSDTTDRRDPAAHAAYEAAYESEARELEAAWAEVEPVTARRLLVAAVLAFAERGYHGTSTRDIATRVGLSPGALYVHYRSKESLLYRISLLGTRQSLNVVRAAAGSEADPTARLRNVIEALTIRGANYHTTGRVIEYELGSLDADHHAEIAELRREISACVRGILDDGVAAGLFDVPDVSATTVALLSLTVDVARWYRTGGRRSPEEVGVLYAELAERMVRRV